eukprot:TRINITY_DN2564_c0_g2_i1.p1 TRINITY_DN2564_c0_g2~~TRINITY_DN2564_c0_g2_i1.p1  ORF type:complete len:297 (+),score=54.14 TRINITY_DN2564_c0_g2_i1:44-892(+)
MSTLESREKKLSEELLRLRSLDKEEELSRLKIELKSLLQELSELHVENERLANQLKTLLDEMQREAQNWKTIKIESHKETLLNRLQLNYSHAEQIVKFKVLLKEREFERLQSQLDSKERELLDLTNIKRALEADVLRYEELLIKGESGFGFAGTRKRKRQVERTTSVGTEAVSIRIEPRVANGHSQEALRNISLLRFALDLKRIEIGNKSTTDTQDISGYKIRTSESVDPFCFPEGLKIPPQGVVYIWYGEKNRDKNHPESSNFFWTPKDVFRNEQDPLQKD